jgi:L-cysteine desulfidase
LPDVIKETDSLVEGGITMPEIVTTEITEYISHELLALVPVLNIIGVFIKRSEKISNNLIPAILGGIGIVLSILWVLSTSTFFTWHDVLKAFFTAIVQGILCAGAAVYLHSGVKCVGELLSQKKNVDSEKTDDDHTNPR